ncbi:MAG: prepilin-type N-terminal cleavage/methylation domain-containing protein [Gammaproteobacteria bacterium]|nr:prepilin-type N-terminal cleavage/methylation domain-containing protein [Gammaproteobacteria bacterium]
MKPIRSQAGYTLMELMIVAAVMAVLVMAAYPAYVGYVTRAHDTEAIEEITSLEVMIGRAVIDTGNYSTATDNASILSIYGWSPATANGNFDYSVVANSGCPGGSGSCYTITATGLEGTAVDGRKIVKTSWGSLKIGDKVIRQ